MAWKNTNASAFFANSATETRVQKVTLSGEHATAIGSIDLRTGGSGGTVQYGPIYVQAGDTVGPIEVPYVKADFVTVDNAVAIVEFQMVKGT